MPRPRRCRCVCSQPRTSWFGPHGHPGSGGGEVVLTVDELEAVRLADLRGLYQEDAAARMGISRQTFGRIVQEARKKIAESLVEGKALRIRGGDYTLARAVCSCTGCGHTWGLAADASMPCCCPECGSAALACDPQEEGALPPGRPGRKGGPFGGPARC